MDRLISEAGCLHGGAAERCTENCLTATTAIGAFGTVKRSNDDVDDRSASGVESRPPPAPVGDRSTTPIAPSSHRAARSQRVTKKADGPGTDEMVSEPASGSVAPRSSCRSGGNMRPSDAAGDT